MALTYPQHCSDGEGVTRNIVQMKASRSSRSEATLRAERESASILARPIATASGIIKAQNPIAKLSKKGNRLLDQQAVAVRTVPRDCAVCSTVPISCTVASRFGGGADSIR